MSNHRKLLRAALMTLLVLALVCVTGHPVAAAGKPGPAVKYTMTLLPALGSYVCRVTGMNNHGDVVGIAADNALGRGFYCLAPYLQSVDLNASKNLPAGWRVTAAVDINDAGQISGNYRCTDPDGTARDHAFVYDLAADQFRVIPQPPGLPWSYAQGINNFGQITGELQNDGATIARVFVWTPGSNPILLGIGYNASGLDINDAGQLIYLGTAANGERHAFRYTPAPDPAYDLYEDLGVLGPLPDGTSKSVAGGLNMAGQVVGQSTSTAGWRAYRYTDGVGMVNLGTLDATGVTQSEAVSINDAGQVVGWSAIRKTRDYAYHPMLYTDATGRLNLWSLVTNPPAGMTENDMGLGADLNGMGIINPVAGKTFGRICGTARGLMYVLTPDR
jgi:probable HAF family extracellular repeat protein